MSAKELSRREFLKVAIAASGAVAAAGFLPGKWLKPVIHTGVLPAHAQVSPTYKVSSTATPTGGTVGGGITNISASVTDGAGAPVSGVSVTMDITTTPPVSLSAPASLTPIPQTQTTGADGVAHFTNLYGNCTPPTSGIYLTFAFALPGSYSSYLGPYMIYC